MSAEAVLPSDRALASLAIIKVGFDRQQSFIANFAAFLRHCLSHSEADLVSAPEMQQAVAREFGLDLPQAILQTLLRREEREGTIIREHGTYRINRTRLGDADLETDRADALRQQGSLLAALVKHASSVFERDWSREHARELLMAYLEEYSTGLLAAAVVGRTLSLGQHGLKGDAYIVHHFALHAAREDPRAFSSLEVMVKGKMLADAVYLGDREFERQAASLGHLEVYFDGPLLLFLLGYAGEEMAAPYRELLGMLKEQDAVLRCFRDGAIEAQQILDAAADRVSTGVVTQAFRGDVVSYLVRSGKTRSDIELMSTRLEQNLLRLGIQTVERPPASERLTTDEQGLEKLLKARGGYASNPRAVQIDIDAVTAIHRLREGRTPQALERTRAVFVTKNAGLVDASARSFDQKSSSARAVPNCVHAAAFTTIIWLRQPLAAPDLPKERIIADAYAAMSPGEHLWRAYCAEVDRLRGDDVISDEDSHLLRLSEESRQALMDTTLGDDSAYVEGTAMQVLERSRELLTAGLTADVEAQRAGREEAERALALRQETIELRGRKAGQLVGSTVFFGLAILLVVGLVIAVAGSLGLPTIVVILCAAVVGLLTLADIVLGHSLKDLQSRVATATERSVVRGLLWLSGG
jgi:hypothetical protein